MWWLEQWEGHTMIMMIQLCHYHLQALSLSLSLSWQFDIFRSVPDSLLTTRTSTAGGEGQVSVLPSPGLLRGRGDHYCHLFEVIAIYNIHGSASNNSSSTCFFPSEDWMEFYKAKLHNLMASYRDIAFFSSHCESSLWFIPCCDIFVTIYLNNATFIRYNWRCY